MPATSPSRLEVLKDARKLAESVGAVKDGYNFFERKNGKRQPVTPGELRCGEVKPEQVCGVCIVGACVLAEVVAHGDAPDWEGWLIDAADAVADVLEVGERRYYAGGELTRAITDKGLPYVLSVLDRMVEREQERS